MVRLFGYPMTPDEFEDLLALALQGGIQSDTGSWGELDDVFLLIARLAPERDETLIRRARGLFEAGPPDGDDWLSTLEQ